MRLDELFADLGDVRLPAVPESGWPDVRGIHHDSRRVRAGDLFVAIAGDRFDGRDFVSEATGRGAVAVLGPAPVDGRGTQALTVPWVETANPRRLMGLLGSRIFGAAHRRLRVVGVTGTNGKSTIVTMVGSVLEAADEPTAVLGTLGYRFGHEQWTSAGRTTPEATDLHRMLSEMEARGARAVAMEVSSHALALGRVDGLRLDVAVFTHLTRDHLDFHGDMESYFSAKAQLFDRLRPAVGEASGGRAVIHLGDSWGRRLHRELLHKGQRPITFGYADGDVRVLDASLDLNGIRATIHTPRGELKLTSSLIGRFNLENLLAVVAVGEALALRHDDVAKGIAAVPEVAGRLETVIGDAASRLPFPMLVDYAHTPGALESALQSVRDLSDRRLAVVFGCGGDRDRGKRPVMGAVAGRLADLAVLTSDNPRTEDPAAILAEVETGLRGEGDRSAAETIIEVDRRQAIRQAVAHAAEGSAAGESWLVLVAGKGHESTQDLGHEVVAFDDREELLAAAADVLAESPGLPSQLQVDETYSEPNNGEAYHG